MAELVNIAGDGFPLYIWAKYAKPGQSAWDVGLERARLGLGGFAYENTVVREADGQVAACLIGYPLANTASSTDELPAPLGPLVELGRLAPPASWFLNVLATFPAYRGRGYASALLGMAEQLAREHAARQPMDANGRLAAPVISLTTSDANAQARRLYARHGYHEVASRSILKEDWQHAGKNWLLLVKHLE